MTRLIPNTVYKKKTKKNDGKSGGSGGSLYVLLDSDTSKMTGCYISEHEVPEGNHRKEEGERSDYDSSLVPQMSVPKSLSIMYQKRQ